MNIYNLFFTLLLNVFLSTTIYAQGVPSPTSDPSEGVPIDGGITALLLGGAVYGAKKLKER
jgi:hypothetical protein